jgi:hypothetical protein
MEYTKEHREQFAEIVQAWCSKFTERQDFIRTFTGRKWYHNAPRAEDVSVQDIAHALSQLTRYTGHLAMFYSVAEHSVRVSRLVPEVDAWEGLFHDATEAYCQDLSRPFKRSPGMEVYKYYEALNYKAIAEALNLDQEPQSVKEADLILLAWEKRDLFRQCQHPETWAVWSAAKGECPTDKIPNHRLVPWTAMQAEFEFMNRFYELGGTL